MTKQTAKPVIFIDFGGVYFTMARPVVSIYAKKFGLPRRRLWNAITGNNWTQHSCGRIDEKAYWNNIKEAADLSDKQTKQLRSALYSYSKPQKGMVNLIRKIKRKATVVVLSDNISGWVKFLGKRYNISKEFHEQHYSFHHNCGKPNVNLFKRAAKKMKVKYKNCIVIDNDKIFLSGVKKTGAKVVLFKDSKNLESRLVTYGVRL